MQQSHCSVHDVQQGKISQTHCVMVPQHGCHPETKRKQSSSFSFPMTSLQETPVFLFCFVFLKNCLSSTNKIRHTHIRVLKIRCKNDFHCQFFWFAAQKWCLILQRLQQPRPGSAAVWGSKIENFLHLDASIHMKLTGVSITLRVLVLGLV